METKEIRRAVLMTQGEFAEALGVSESAVHKWEMRGAQRRAPGLRSLKKIRVFCEERGIKFSLSETEGACCPTSGRKVR